jgi:hypothetical protein
LSQTVEETIVEESFYNRRLIELISSIEEKTPVKFYFKGEWVAPVRIFQGIKGVPLDEYLKIVLEGTDLSFRLIDDYSVALYKDVELIKRDYYVAQSAEIYEKVVLGNPTRRSVSGQVKLVGKITEGKTERPLAGASIQIKDLNIGAVSDSLGVDSLQVPVGSYLVHFNYLGLEEEIRRFIVYGPGVYNVSLYEEAIELKEVVVADDDLKAAVENTEMGVERLSIEEIESMPAFLGEVDVIKSVWQLPGVNVVGESSAGFNVRGGSQDQNLILLDDAPLFNPTHVLGLFSSINSDAIRSLDFYRANIPAQFGGRISSVMDIRVKEGEDYEWVGSGGIGLVSSRLNLSGPIVKEKTRFLVSGRSSYSDWMLNLAQDLDVRNSSAFFYDGIVKLSQDIGKLNSLNAMAYHSYDQYKFASDTTYSWRSTAASLNYNHLFSNTFVGNFSGIFSKYKYVIDNEEGNDAFSLDYSIEVFNIKADLSKTINDHTVDFGAEVIRYGFEPGNLSPLSEASSINPESIPSDQSIETALYISDGVNLTNQLSVSGGLRFSMLMNFGESDVLIYNDELPRNNSSITDTVSYGSGELVKSYFGLEPRLGLRYLINPRSSVKLSYNRVNQYIHLISNTTAITPIDIWKTSNTHLEPQRGNQFAAGYFRNFVDDVYTLSIEGFYKNTNNVAEYKNGADLVLNPHLERDIVQGELRSYGTEFSLKKNKGRLSGWLNYTYTRAEMKVNGDFEEETINDGEFYPANFDRPHNLKFFFEYKISRRYSLSSNFIFASGIPLTTPTSYYIIEGISLADFGDRNQARIPNYHRLDLSLNIKTNLKKDKKWEGSWNITLYNVYARRNAYSVFYRRVENVPRPFRLSVLGTIFPSVTYNFKF